MVKTIVNFTKKEQEVIDAVKIKFSLSDNNQALSLILKWYEERELEPQFGSDFVDEIEKARKCGRFVKVKRFQRRI